MLVHPTYCKDNVKPQIFLSQECAQSVINNLFFCFSTSLVLKICNFLRYSNCGLLFGWLLLCVCVVAVVVFFWGGAGGGDFSLSFFFLFFLISRVLLPVKCSPQEWLPLFLLGVCVCFFNHSCVNYVLVMQVKHKANAIHLLTCSKS